MGYIQIDLAMSVIALRWKHAPLSAYQQLTNPALDAETAARVRDGELVFQRVGDGWDLVAV